MQKTKRKIKFFEIYSYICIMKGKFLIAKKELQ